MITIQNISKILYKQLDKKNFYVERVVPIFDLTENGTENHKYKIEITNRKYAMNLFLDRIPVVNEQNYYRLYAAGNGLPMYLTIGEIKNLDKFLDKLRLVALG